MLINLENALGIHEKAMRLYAERSAVLASNLANADTPGFKARDIDFRSELGQAKGAMGKAGKMLATHAKHFGMGAGKDSNSDFELLYRQPLQPSLDGNTVDTQQEQAAFTENAMRYIASMTFLSGQFKGLRTALRGE